MANINKKVRYGVVVSDKMEKTATALVERTIRHRLYKKTMRINKKFKFHDPENQCNLGDVVKIIECKPISRDKHWRLLEITKKSI